MSASAAQFLFAAEFVTFLATAAGLAIVVLRGELVARALGARGALGLGFLGLGASAFLHGSRLVEDGDDPVLLALRGTGVVAVALGALSWSGGPTSRRLLWAGLAAIGAAVVAEAVASGDVPNVLLIAGSLAVGASVLGASRRSIAARVAASAAGALLLVVLVLSISLSAVLSNTVEDQELTRLDARANSEATFARRESTARLAESKVVAANLAGQRAQVLLDLAAPESDGNVNGDLALLSGTYFLSTPLAFVAPNGKVLGATGLDPPTVLALAGSEVVRQAIQTQQQRASIDIVAGRPLAVAASPARVNVAGGQPVLLGVAVAVSRLDDAYLNVRSSDDASLSLALADRSGFMASFGPRPPGSVLPRATEVIDTGRPTSMTTPARFVAIRPVRTADERPVVAMIASTPTTIVSDSRDRLFRTLFVIALGGTLLALLIASVVGERIGSGVRRLTRAAEGIQRGELAVRADIATEDEVGVLGAAFDSMAVSIQEKTEAETRLRSRLEAVVAGMGEALVAVDAAGNVTDFNHAAEELLGIGAAQARERRADQVIALRADDGRDIGERLTKLSPTRWNTEGWVEQPDGARVPVSVLGGPLRDIGGELAGAVFVLRDLRREREVEQMKTEFLSRIGHELRTPLTGIMGYADLLTRKKVPLERAQQWHTEILKQSKALFRIVQMLEFFASSGAGRVMLRPEVIDAGSIVDDVVRRWSDRVDGRRSITRRVSRGVPKLNVDRRWLTLSIDELVDNAVKFSPDGGKISVTVSPHESGVELAVIDRGKGMSAQEQELAFADFVQGDTSDTRSYGGLGLGLSLVQRVAEAHGGSVSVLSEPGKGSRFSIFLPGAPIQKKR